MYRLLKSNPVKQADFHSHSKLGLVAPVGVDACRWSSCSVFKNLDAAKKMQLLPKFKLHKHIARLTLGKASGRIVEGGSGHCDWWIYRSFDPVNAATIVI